MHFFNKSLCLNYSLRFFASYKPPATSLYSFGAPKRVESQKYEVVRLNLLFITVNSKYLSPYLICSLSNEILKVVNEEILTRDLIQSQGISNKFT